MSSMFENYEKTNYIPNNLYKFLPVESQYRDIMVLNAFNNYSFTIPHKSEDILDASVFYMQGTEHKLKKEFWEITLTDLNINNRCVATYCVTPQESLLFNTYNKEVKVQLKVELFDGTIEYSPIFSIKVIDSLDKDIKEESGF